MLPDDKCKFGAKATCTDVLRAELFVLPLFSFLIRLLAMIVYVKIMVVSIFFFRLSLAYTGTSFPAIGFNKCFPRSRDNSHTDAHEWRTQRKNQQKKTIEMRCWKWKQILYFQYMNSYCVESLSQRPRHSKKKLAQCLVCPAMPRKDSEDNVWVCVLHCKYFG